MPQKNTLLMFLLLGILIGSVAATFYQVASFERQTEQNGAVLLNQISILNREFLNQSTRLALLNATQSIDEGRLAALSALLTHLKSGLGNCALIDESDLNKVDYSRYWVLAAFVWDIRGGQFFPLVCQK